MTGMKWMGRRTGSKLGGNNDATYCSQPTQHQIYTTCRDTVNWPMVEHGWAKWKTGTVTPCLSLTLFLNPWPFICPLLALKPWSLCSTYQQHPLATPSSLGCILRIASTVLCLSSLAYRVFVFACLQKSSRLRYTLNTPLWSHTSHQTALWKSCKGGFRRRQSWLVKINYNQRRTCQKQNSLGLPCVRQQGKCVGVFNLSTKLLYLSAMLSQLKELFNPYNSYPLKYPCWFILSTWYKLSIVFGEKGPLSVEELPP